MRYRGWPVCSTSICIAGRIYSKTRFWKWCLEYWVWASATQFRFWTLEWKANSMHVAICLHIYTHDPKEVIFLTTDVRGNKRNIRKESERDEKRTQDTRRAWKIWNIKLKNWQRKIYGILKERNKVESAWRILNKIFKIFYVFRFKILPRWIPYTTTSNM